jgi:ribosomal protein L37AE/L43A
MARMSFGYSPQGNPCAQCGEPIATPEWIEDGPRRIAYLWHCWACDYKFEAVAYFEDQESGSEALAA